MGIRSLAASAPPLLSLHHAHEERTPGIDERATRAGGAADRCNPAGSGSSNGAWLFQAADPKRESRGKLYLRLQRCHTSAAQPIGRALGLVGKRGPAKGAIPCAGLL